MGDNSLSKVDGAINHRLFLFAFQDPWDDGLSSDSVTTVIHHHSSQGIKPLKVHSAVYTHTLQVVPLYNQAKYDKLIFGLNRIQLHSAIS